MANAYAHWQLVVELLLGLDRVSLDDYKPLAGRFLGEFRCWDAFQRGVGFPGGLKAQFWLDRTVVGKRAFILTKPPDGHVTMLIGLEDNLTINNESRLV